MIHLEVGHEQLNVWLLNFVLVGYIGLELSVIAYIIYLI